MTDWFTFENELAKQEALQFPHRKFKDTVKKQEHTLQDTVDEIQAVREAQSAGSYRIVLPGNSPLPAVAFVRYSETDQYNLMTEAEYKSSERAELAIALITRPFALSPLELHRLLTLLEGK